MNNFVQHLEDTTEKKLDLKKVIAYSTCSQLGLMVLASGGLCFSSRLYHLLTHACFKALLFLGAGSVIKNTCVLT